MGFIIHTPRFETHYQAGTPGFGGVVIYQMFCCDEHSWYGSRKSAKAWYRRHLMRSH